MKKIVQPLFLLAVLVCGFLFSSCSKHAFSMSDNKFEYVKGNTPSGHVGNTLTITPGETIYFYASSSPDHNRLTGGAYKVKVDDSAVLSVKIDSWGGDRCVSVTGKNEGTTSVHLDFLWKGFDLYKSVGITVKAAEGGE